MNIFNKYNFIKKFKNEKSLKLTEQEKRTLRMEFLSEAKIISTNEVATKSNFYTPSPYTKYFKRHSFVLVSVFTLIFAVTSVAFAAEKSLPGNILYPIKTQINERALRALSGTSESAKQEFEIKLVEKRLIEAEELDQKQSLNVDNIEKVKEAVIDQTIRASKAMNEKDNIEVINRKSNVKYNENDVAKDKLDKYDEPDALKENQTLPNQNDSISEEMKGRNEEVSREYSNRLESKNDKIETISQHEDTQNIESEQRKKDRSEEKSNKEKARNAELLENVLSKHEDIVNKLQIESKSDNDKSKSEHD